MRFQLTQRLTSDTPRLLEENADQAHDDVDDEEPCLVSPDAVGQGQRLDKRPAHLQTVQSNQPESSLLAVIARVPYRKNTQQGPSAVIVDQRNIHQDAQDSEPQHYDCPAPSRASSRSQYLRRASCALMTVRGRELPENRGQGRKR